MALWVRNGVCIMLPGATIEEDRELLSAAANPILSELRASGKQAWSATEQAKLRQEIRDCRKALTELRQKRYMCIFVQCCVHGF